MKNLKEKQKKLLSELFTLGRILKGSISSVCSSCHRANCICKNKSNKMIYRLTYKDKGQKTKTVYIHRANLKKVKTMIKNFEKVKKIVDELVELNITILKSEQKIASEKKK